MDCASDLALLLKNKLLNIMQPSPFIMKIGGAAAELLKKVLLIITTLLYATIALPIPLLLIYIFVLMYEDNIE